MSNCLGLYIENNLIKYAKLSKEKDNIKIEAYGVKFFDDLEKTIEQIVRETYSFKTLISVNIANEKYVSRNIFRLLSKRDLDKAISTEFDYFCNEQTKNSKALEYRYITMPNLDDNDKFKVLYAYVDKANIVERMQLLDKYRTSNISPIATSIANLAVEKDAQNSLIINLEAKTTITILLDGKPYIIETLDEGMQKIINNIAERENSFSKAYEICKNTTIYTKAGQNLQLEENDYLDYIMPDIYTIMEKTKEIIEKSNVDINNIYITGTGAIINNIDLYFQENFMDKKCEILVPFFAKKANLKINIKDYVEVNSAIAVALEGLTPKQDTAINFLNRNEILETIKEILTIEIGKGSPKKSISSSKIKFNVSGNFDWIEKGITRSISAVLMALIVYIGVTTFLNKGITSKIEEANQVIEDTNTKIETVKENAVSVNKKTTQYTTLLEKIEEKENSYAENISRKNAIPNFLNQIMFLVPSEVQILSIENTSNKKIKIIAESKEYQQLGYFKAAIQNDVVLTNVTSTSGTNNNGVITIEITGELPY